MAKIAFKKGILRYNFIFFQPYNHIVVITKDEVQKYKLNIKRSGIPYVVLSGKKYPLKVLDKKEYDKIDGLEV